MKIILASKSPRRRELLEQIGITYEVCPAQGDEIITKTNPQEVVCELAMQKAQEVAAHYTDGIILGADTIVVLDNQIMGKPKDENDAFRMLSGLQGKTHQVYTGVALLEKKEGAVIKVKNFAEMTEVTMYPAEAQELLDYIATKDPMDKAGAYAIQGKSAVFIQKINGDYNNVVGLPAARIYQELKNW